MSTHRLRILEQAAAIPYRIRKGQTEIMLVTSKSGKKWIVPKGLIEIGQTSHEAASVEAYEEAGVMGRVIGHPLTSFTYEKWGAICRVRVYRMEVTRTLRTWPEARFRKRQWINLSKFEDTMIDSGIVKGYFNEPLKIALLRLKKLVNLPLLKMTRE